MANVLQVIGLNTVTPQLEAGQTSNLDTYSMVSPLTINPSGTAGYSGTNALTVTGNVSANALYQGTTNQAATTSIQLTASSVTSWIITGSGGQTIILPDATTLPVGAIFTFNNNQSSGAITVNVFGSGSTPATVQSGGYATVTLLTKSVAAGTWDVHYGTPSNVTWSTNTFNYPGTITGATWNGVAVPVLYGGTGTTTSTGTAGSVVLSNTPTLVTPVLGAASGTSLDLTSATGLTLNGAILAKTNTLLFAPVSFYIAPGSTATTISVTGASWASGVATLTFSALTTKLPVGMVITITGMTPSGYNASNVQITASSTTSVAFALFTNPGAFSVGGAITGGNTYTPSSGAVVLDVLVCSGGGGGGGGVVNAASVSGGAGGGSGGSSNRRYRTAEIGGSATISLGAGGLSGGVGVAGGAGSTTSFTPSLLAGAIALTPGSGGGGYFGGIASNTGGGGAGGGCYTLGGNGSATAGGSAFNSAGAGGFNGAISNVFVVYNLCGAPGTGGGGGAIGATGGSGGSGAGFSATGGGSGGGNAAVSGGTSGLLSYGQTSGGAAGAAGANAITNYPLFQGQGGGGGGGATTGTAGAGGNGFNGGGGGGGGSSASGTAAAGGKGGDGFVSIVEYF